ncbi:MAG: indole-3-glycerol phosphate synthase TrpC [Deltaproteobacteria bacterium]|nr:indole-3-glycerol phosphate synthase TrpC [Deltaproteobacteria bacterium]
MFREILIEKQKEVERLRATDNGVSQDRKPSPIRDFKGAISQPGGINLIAEIKFASPSAGLIRPKSDPCSIGKAFQQSGAAAVSLVTDNRFFGGDIRHLPRLKEAIALPLLRKDFLIDEIQVRESLLCSADAVLLIARILPAPKLKALLRLCRELELSALTEIHDRRDLDKALHCGADIIGINNRNLDTFQIDPGTTVDLSPWVPEGRVIVSESGIGNEADIHSLRKCGVHAVLVGTSIMKSVNPADKVRSLVRAGRGEDGQGQVLRYHE